MDRATFSSLVEQHYDTLMRVCARVAPERAEDAAQEAVLQAMLSLDRLRRPESFGPWLIGIGLNVARTRRRPHALVHDVCVPSPHEIVEAREVSARVRAAIATLPSGQREAVTLFYLAGLTHAETAAHLGTAASAVKSRLHKARASLRPHLTDLKEPSVIPMHVTDIRRVEDRHVVVLSGDGAELPIWVGQPEAIAMVQVLEEVELPRPGAHHFTQSLVSAAGISVERIVITRLASNVFYATVSLSGGATIDARPSDALTLALLAGAEILVDRAVLDAARQPVPETHDADRRVLASEERDRIQREAAEYSLGD